MGNGSEQDEARGALGKCKRIRRRKSAAPGVANQDCAPHTKLLKGARDQLRLSCRQGVIVTLRP
jgi:hypothetical protein